MGGCGCVLVFWRCMDWPVGRPSFWFSDRRALVSARLFSPSFPPLTLYWDRETGTNSWSKTASAVKSGAVEPTRGACRGVGGQGAACERDGEWALRHGGALLLLFACRKSASRKGWYALSSPMRHNERCLGVYLSPRHAIRASGGVWALRRRAVFPQIGAASQPHRPPPPPHQQKRTAARQTRERRAERTGARARTAGRAVADREARRDIIFDKGRGVSG